MPAAAAVNKKPISIRGVAPKKDVTAKRAAVAKKEPLASKRKPAEVMPLVEEVFEEISNEMTVTAAAPQIHEVELIPVKRNSFVDQEEKMADGEEKKVDVPAQRRASEGSEHQRRIKRGDSEVKIEEILCSIFEDITTVPKKSDSKTSTTSKSHPTSMKPPVPKAPVPRNSPKVVPKPKMQATESKPAIPQKIENKPAIQHKIIAVKTDDKLTVNGQAKPLTPKKDLMIKKAAVKSETPKPVTNTLGEKVETIRAPAQSKATTQASKVEEKNTTRSVAAKTVSTMVKKPEPIKQSPVQKTK